MRLDREDYALLPRHLGVEAREPLATAARPNAGVSWAMTETRALWAAEARHALRVRVVYGPPASRLPVAARWLL